MNIIQHLIKLKRKKYEFFCVTNLLLVLSFIFFNNYTSECANR